MKSQAEDAENVERIRRDWVVPKLAVQGVWFLLLFPFFVYQSTDRPKNNFFLEFFFLCLWWVSFFSQLFEYFSWNQSLAKEKKTNFCCRFSSSNYLVMFSWSSAGCGFEFHNSASKKEFWGFFIEKSVSIMCCGI